METRDLDGINVEETTTVDEQRSNNGKTFAKVAAGIGAGAAAGAGVMAMVDDDVTTPDVEPTELVDASDVADVTAGHIADNNAAEAWPQKHDNEAWPQEQPVDAVHTVKLDMQDGVLSPAVPFSGYMADMYTPDGHSLLLDVNGDGVYDIAMSYDDDTYTINDLSLVDDGSTVRLDDEGVVDVLDDEPLDDQIGIPDDAVDDLSSDGYLYEM